MFQATKKSFSRPFVPLALAFLLLNLLVTQGGGQNAKARLLAMRSFVEEGNFRLDHRLRVTDDWSQAPNGHYYSNKAPGPLLLGLPVFFVVDKIHELGEHGYRDEQGLRSDPGYAQSTATSFLMQALPFALLALACAAWLARTGRSPGAVWFFLLAALFGNTASLFMNSYFGHGLSALLQLGALYFLLVRAYGWSGMLFAFSLLSDYGFAVQIPALLAALWLERPSPKEWGRFCLGAVPGALLWIAYHGAIFGSPFAIASRFQNPVFLGGGGGGPQLWGMISLPKLSILWELVAGGSRGLVLQQPWLLWLLPFVLLAWVRRPRRSPALTTAVFSLGSLAALLLLNAGYNGWHGGASAGPRYLSGVLPCCALMAGLWLDRLGKGVALAAWGLLLVGILFRSFVYGGTILAPLTALWPYYFHELVTRPTAELRFALFWLVLGGAVFWTRKRLRSGRGGLA